MLSRVIRKPLWLAVALSVLLGGAQVAAQVGAGDPLLPPNAKPGECYARVLVPAQFKTESVTILKAPASEQVSVVSPRFETVTEQILTKAASTRLEAVPAEFEWVEERIMTKAASTRLEPVPAQWETVTETIVEKPGYTFWKKGTGPVQKLDNMTGEIMCLEEVAPVYKSVTKQVLKSPAATREVEIPAEFMTVRRQVVKTPATTREIQVPAEYMTVTKTVMAEPAREVRTPVAAQYETVTQTVKVADERVAWQTVECEAEAAASPAMAPAMPLDDYQAP